MASPFVRYHSVWEAKPLLRRIYADFHDRIARNLVAGPTLEIGGGIGQFKNRYADVIASDIQQFPGLDVVADAQALPFADRSLGNIVMIDALHHIEFPKLFLEDADRVLRPGGRVVMVEPAITWGSALFYRFLHQEPVNMAADPLALGQRSADRDPYDSNQAIPTLLCTRDRHRLTGELPSLAVAHVEWFSFFVYPLSGGFKSWSLLPEAVGRVGLRLERQIEPLLGRHLGFRLLAVIEKAEEGA